MSLTTLATMATLGLASLNASEAETSKSLLFSQTQPFISTQGYVTPQSGQYKTTRHGCTYRRTQAPGHAARWILVVNPHHVGGRNAKRVCKGML